MDKNKIKIFTYKKFIIISLSVFANIIITACSVDTKSINLEDEVYLSFIFGQYKLSDSGASLLNTADNYFINTPNPSFSTMDIFTINNFGQMDIYIGVLRVTLQFEHSISDDANSAVFEVINPLSENSGSLIKNNRYLKIKFDNNTNLIFSSEYADNSQDAEKLSASLLFSTRL